MILVVTALLVGTLMIMVLTGVGARERGRGLPAAIVAAVFFPITWATWYLRDERPGDRASR